MNMRYSERRLFSTIEVILLTDLQRKKDVRVRNNGFRGQNLVEKS